MKNNRIFAFIAVVILVLSGCTGSSTKTSAIQYRFCSETRNKIVKFRAVLKPGDIANVSLKSGYGPVAWMAEEGSRVASGELVLEINMDDIDLRVKRSEKNIASQLDLFTRVRSANPAEMADLKLNLRTRQLEFERAEFDRKWLFKPKTDGEIWKLQSDMEAAKINFEITSKLHELKKNVTDKGFDSAFSLRSSEIDKKSREIELDYAQRLLKQLQSPPLTEELAQIDFQKTVASGEIWLAENRVVSASISSQIREKSLEVVLERHRSSFREQNQTLEEAKKLAPRDGIVIHPYLWGDFRFRVGQHAWPGVAIVQVIGDGKYYLEALLLENQVNGLKEKASATVVLDSQPAKSWKGEVKTIGKAPKPMRGAKNSGIKFIPVEITLNASESLVFGDKGDVTVDLGSFSGVFLPRDLIKTAGSEKTILLQTTFGSQETAADLEDFDHDWVIWKNPPQSEGVILFR
ncbi:MAG: HlyD family efflux transporter periplasmic adaptor subunit [Candidatus Riflebacteria bacterium]